MTDPHMAPPLEIERWVQGNPVTLQDLRGRVVLLEAFQMLCPGCVDHALPQAKRVHQAFRPEDVAVIGLHTVFEHHDVTGPDALRVFLSEFRYTFPVAVAAHSEGDAIPPVMRSYQMQGTPTTVLIDRAGRVRHQRFGAVEDLALGAMLGSLIAEAPPSAEG